MVQFQHRMAAYLLLALAVLHALRAQGCALGKRAARRAVLLAALVLIQAALGMTTLVLAVPLWAALAHQTTAMAVLGMAVIHRRKINSLTPRLHAGIDRLDPLDMARHGRRIGPELVV